MSFVLGRGTFIIAMIKLNTSFVSTKIRRKWFVRQDSKLNLLSWLCLTDLYLVR